MGSLAVTQMLITEQEMRLCVTALANGKLYRPNQPSDTRTIVFLEGSDSVNCKRYAGEMSVGFDLGRFAKSVALTGWSRGLE